MKKTLGLLLLALLLVRCLGPGVPERPNILWITCEDISPYLGSYGCPEARTPNLDRLASEGIRYTKAYANAPVCAVARSTLLTGMYATALGTHNMRCYTRLPASIPAYPKIFREAGYYCTNNAKKDYNSPFQEDTGLWDESSSRAHFRDRGEGQPFLAVFNFTVTHESQLSAENQQRHMESGHIPSQPRIDPEDIVLPPYHPDLPEIRWDWARLHDLITRMDAQVGEILRDLEEDGLEDNTIVFFYSDHGGMLSRSKRYLCNVGTQVPLIIRIPEKWGHLAPVEPGGTEERLVSFIDFPKTILSLAGLPIPAQMQGRIFLGPDTEPAPGEVYFSRDRMGARFDFSRAVTDGRYYYIRNFMPHRPRGRDSRYGYQVQANWGAWEKHFDAGACDEVQSQFFQPKPAVELFDTRNDPWHIHNLAGEPEYTGIQRDLSAKLDRWMMDCRDLGLVPESMYDELTGNGKAFTTLHDYGKSDVHAAERRLQAAGSGSLGDPARQTAYLALMGDSDPVVRYWGAYGVFLLAEGDPAVRSVLEKMMLQDDLTANRLMAAQALGVLGSREAAFRAIDQAAMETASPTVFLHAINALQYSFAEDMLELGDWHRYRDRTIDTLPGVDMTNRAYADRIMDDALEIWPAKRKVYE
jgi:arylsulfatase A-like enzyme